MWLQSIIVLYTFAVLDKKKKKINYIQYFNKNITMGGAIIII